MGTELALPLDDVALSGTLTEPDDASGLVMFAHGSGSSRFSPRNRFVAEHLHGAGLATLLFDLLTPDEEGDRRLVFDIELLAHRLTQVTELLRDGMPPIAYFGASTGAAAALWAAAEPGADITAVVSRGGRPDLAAARLPAVRAPTLLLVGSLDTTVIELNELAAAQMTCEHELRIVPGATHLFAEPGTLEIVAEQAREWFIAHGDG
ncbi:alpha/beta hydrolase [Rhodococcus sp. ABRD24]|uniref:dienelactone hydrolase family protein n=1 Tax=Rhodococcus sp. ABRD24 TaxID=2507582 RepID=UPI00103F4363|nr:alpha/beta family hydrolase [Rhodococcus sp. ABRD24]QBJ95680.1 alpha/beta hydrolase [Rhodococcus sp. ABRD24]